jgi:succinate dehydrogenase/fumarate reductase flavoprotein subunit
LFAAIKARQNGTRNVIIVDKGTVAVTGKSTLAAGSTIYLHPEDDLESWHRAVFLGQQGICNQDMVEALLIQSTERLREIEGMGIVYRKIPGTKKYFRTPSRGLVPAMMTRRPTYKGLTGGSAITTVLRKEALRLGVAFYNKIFISDLIVRDDQVHGAVGCQRRTGDFFIFQSGAVVVAATDCSFRGNYACVEQVTGDTFAMAHHAGADLNNMEMMTINTAPLSYNFEGTGPAGKYGAKFLNARDEDFMPRYHSEGSGAEINFLVQSMAQEIRQGHGPPFYFDFRPTPSRTESLYMSMGGWMPRNLKRLKEKDIHIFESKVPWAPAIQTLRGGIKTDFHCMSNIKGLFASGTAHSTGPGLFNGWSSAKCIWSGSTAGTFAARYLDGLDVVKLDQDKIVRLKDRLYNRKIDPDTGEKTLNEITRMLQRVMFSYETSIFKSDASLKKAMGEVDGIKENELPRAQIPNYHEFIKFKETENMVLTAELFLKASLLRKESRSDHKREDFPERNDKEWLKWIVFNKNLKEGYRLEDLPWERYKFQPDDLE